MRQVMQCLLQNLHSTVTKFKMILLPYETQKVCVAHVSLELSQISIWKMEGVMNGYITNQQ